MSLPVYDCPKCGRRYRLQASRILRHVRACIGSRAYTVRGVPIKAVNTSMLGTKVRFIGRDGRNRVGRIVLKRYRCSASLTGYRGPYACVHYWDSSGMARNLFLGSVRNFTRM